MPLIEAVKRNAILDVRSLLSGEFDRQLLNETEDGQSAVHFAAQQGSARLIYILGEAGANLNQTTRDGTAPLHIAVGNGDTEVVRALTTVTIPSERTPINVNLPLQNGKRPLHLALEAEHSSGLDNTEVLRLLLAAGANVRLPDSGGHTPIHTAARLGLLNPLNLLLVRSVRAQKSIDDDWQVLYTAPTDPQLMDIPLPSTDDESSTSAPPQPTAASMVGTQLWSLVSSVFSRFYTPPQPDSLHASLLDSGQYVFSKMGQWLYPLAGMVTKKTPVNDDYSVVRCRHQRLEFAEVAFFVNNAVDATTDEGLTPLHLAASGGFLPLVRVLIPVVQQVDFPSHNGSTALHYAARGNHPRTIITLAEGGANVNYVNHAGDTPLHTAVRLGHLDAVLALVGKKANVNQLTADSLTPLHLAAQRGLFDIAGVLVQNKASLETTTPSGLSALDLANQNQDTNLVELLMGANKAPDSPRALPASSTALNRSFLNECGAIRINIGIEAKDFGINEDHPLGKGSFSVVYQGTYRGSIVAVKRLVENNSRPLNFETLQQEVSVMAHLRHANIVQFYGVCLDPKIPALVMEFCAKGSLHDMLYDVIQEHPWERPQFRVQLKWEQRYALAKGITAGLNHLHHEGILHRDLKSANVLIDSTGQPKLTDFGFSTLTQDFSKTRLAGSILWMSPQLLFDKEMPSPEDDIYALGVVFNEIGSRRQPGKGIKSPEEFFAVLKAGRRDPISPDVPLNFQSCITWCWAQEKSHRPNAQQVLDQLEKSVKRQNTSGKR